MTFRLWRCFVCNLVLVFAIFIYIQYCNVKKFGNVASDFSQVHVSCVKKYIFLGAETFSGFMFKSF